MKRLDLAIGFASYLACAVALADGVATTAQLAVFDLDTRGAYPVVSRSEPVALPYGDGATVTATAPGGAVTTLSAAVNGTNYWTATAGGVWTLENSSEGTARFAVRYNASEQGAGTAESPWVLVDNDELAGLSVTDGFIFVLEGPVAALSEMVRPAGYAIVPDGNAYRLTTAANGEAFIASEVAFRFDSVQPGPDRTVRGKGNCLPFAYSGDDWGGDSAAASTLSFLSPSSANHNEECLGTGVVEYQLKEPGVWTVTLTGDGVTTLTSIINYEGDGFILVVR